MTTFISLLRGINVGGHKKIKMADLKALYESLGLQNVTTYIQSGNVIFTADDEQGLLEKIMVGIEARFGFSVDVTLRTLDEWRKLADGNPYLEQDHKGLHVTLLAEKPDAKRVNNLSEIDPKGDEYHLQGTTIYLHCPNGYGRTILTNAFWEKHLKVSTTTRNWNTVTKLLALAES